MKRKFLLMEMTVAVVLGCALLTWIFDGSLKWIASLPARLTVEQPAQEYSITVLNWGVSGRVLDLSDSGLAVGVAADNEGRTYAALWDDGQTVACHGIDDRFGSEAVTVNDDGTVAFTVGTHQRDVYRSYMNLPNGETLSLNALLPGIRQCNVTGMNAKRTVVGIAENEDGVWQAWVWSPDLGARVVTEGGAMVSDINAQGLIAGMEHTTFPSGSPRIWAPTADGSYEVLEPQPPNTIEGRCYAINSEGTAVGRIVGPRPMRWDMANGLTVLPGLHDTEAGWAHDVNDHGEIAGCLTGVDGGLAVVWRDGKPYDLNRYIPQKLGWHLIEATAINNEGVIACRAVSEDGVASVLLVPFEEETEQQVARR